MSTSGDRDVDKLVASRSDPDMISDVKPRYVVRKRKGKEVNQAYAVWDSSQKRPLNLHLMRKEQAEDLCARLNAAASAPVSEVRDIAPSSRSLEAALQEITRRASAGSDAGPANDRKVQPYSVADPGAHSCSKCEAGSSAKMAAQWAENDLKRKR